MTDSKVCLGHEERGSRKNKIARLITGLQVAPNKNCRILIKKGPITVETSLKELEEGPPMFGLYPNGLSLNGLQGQLDYPELD